MRLLGVGRTTIDFASLRTIQTRTADGSTATLEAVLPAGQCMYSVLREELDLSPMCERCKRSSHSSMRAQEKTKDYLTKLRREAPFSQT